VSPEQLVKTALDLFNILTAIYRKLTALFAIGSKPQNLLHRFGKKNYFYFKKLLQYPFTRSNSKTTKALCEEFFKYSNSINFWKIFHFQTYFFDFQADYYFFFSSKPINFFIISNESQLMKKI
jgi:hypothetical protein